jgi:hypothetical protein
MPTVKIFIQDGDTRREMSDTEYTQYETDQRVNAAQKATADKIATAKLAAHASAVNKLKTLGLTVDEIIEIVGHN